MKYFILLILTASLPLRSCAQNGVNYYFAEVSAMDSSDYSMEFGLFSNNDHNVRKLPDTYTDRDRFIRSIEKKLSELPEEKRNVFIYIHGMWGHRNFYQEEVLSKFDEDIFYDESNPFGIVVSIVWYAGLSYHDNVAHAYRVGRYYYPLFDQLMALNTKKKSILCHSMGNRVFQGIVSMIPSFKNYRYTIDKAFFAAADLEENIFDEGQPLDSIGYLVDQPIVYVHNNDRSLGMSKALNENLRLGLNANNRTCTANEDIMVVDVSAVDDDEGIGPSLSHHRYFYASPTVRNDIKFFLFDRPNPYRTELQCDRWFQVSEGKGTGQ